MVVSCCCHGCENTSVPGKVMGFFGFPRDKKKKDLWLKNIGMKGFVPTKYSRICIKHFTPDSYVFHGARRRMFLNKDAIPTIFNISNKEGKKRQPQQLRNRSFANGEANEVKPPSNKQEEEFKPIAKQGKTIEDSLTNTKKAKIDSPKKRGRPRKNAEKTAPSIEVPTVCVDENNKEGPYVFDKRAFVLEHMGPSYLPRVKRKKPPKVSLGKVKRYRYVLDFTAEEMQNPEKAIKMLRMAQRKVQTQKAEIKVINEEAKMLATKRTSLQKLLRLLVKVNGETNQNAQQIEDLNLEERMSYDSDVEMDGQIESGDCNINNKMSYDDEGYGFEENENDDFMFEDGGSDSGEEAQSDELSYQDVIGSDLKSNLETLEDDQYYIIQITEKDDCELIH